MSSNTLSAGQPDRVKEVPLWMDRLLSEISNLESVVNLLSPVITPKPEPLKETAQSVLCPLANELRQMTERISRVNELILQVEL